MHRSPRVAFVGCLSLLLAATVVRGEDGNRSKFNKALAPGDAAPVFTELPGADGRSHSLADYKDSKVVVVVFASTLCSVVDLYEDRVEKLTRDYEKKGVKVVAISCERRGVDADGLAADLVAADAAKEIERIRDKVAKQGLPFEYLYDGSQKFGRAYGVTATPTCFVLDGKRKIAYLGAFDDNFPEDGVMQHYVRDAVDAVLAGREPETRESLARGCRLDYAEKAGD